MSLSEQDLVVAQNCPKWDKREAFGNINESTCIIIITRAGSRLWCLSLYLPFIARLLLSHVTQIITNNLAEVLLSLHLTGVICESSFFVCFFSPHQSAPPTSQYLEICGSSTNTSVYYTNLGRAGTCRPHLCSPSLCLVNLPPVCLCECDSSDGRPVLQHSCRVASGSGGVGGARPAPCTCKMLVSGGNGVVFWSQRFGGARVSARCSSCLIHC